MKNLFMVFFLSFSMTGCYTVTTWKDGLPKKAGELTTMEAKRKEFDKFVVADIVSGGHEGFVQTNETLNSGKYFNIDDFSPVFLNVDPDNAPLLEKAKSSRIYFNVAVGVTVVGTIVGFGSIFLLGTGGLWIWQMNMMEDLRVSYNDALRRRLDISEAVETPEASKATNSK